jgi:hypothetical protein
MSSTANGCFDSFSILDRQAYVEFTSQQAATAAKHKIDAFGEGQQYVKKHTVTYSNPNVNPFRTLPKDAPMRAGKDGQSNRAPSGGYNNDRGNQSGNFGGNFRGRTPGYNASRGGMNNNNMNGNNFNRNFSNPGMGNMGGGFNPPMGGFQGNPMTGQFGGFNNRGGMMGGIRGVPGGMRGGRGGMGNGMMGGMPMGGMPMGGMTGGMTGGMGGMPMNMSQMGGGMTGMIAPNFQSLSSIYFSDSLEFMKGKDHILAVAVAWPAKPGFMSSRHWKFHRRSSSFEEGDLKLLFHANLYCNISHPEQNKLTRYQIS